MGGGRVAGLRVVGLWGCGVVGLWGCGFVGLWGCGVAGLRGCGVVGACAITPPPKCSMNTIHAVGWGALQCGDGCLASGWGGVRCTAVWGWVPG